MRCAFIHGTHFYVWEEQYYSIHLPAHIWSDYYLPHFEELLICGSERGGDTTTKQELSLSSCQGVKFQNCISFRHPIDYFLHRGKLISEVKQCLEQVDCAIVRLPCMLGNIAAELCRKMKKPYLVEVVGCPWDSLWNHSLKGKFLAPYMTITTRQNVKRATNALYVTTEFLQRRYPTDGEQIGCSDVALEEIDKTVLAQRLEQISHPHKKIMLGTTAAVNVRYKGQQYIIAALGMLKQQGNTQYEYQLVGGGDQSYLKNIAEKHGVSDQVKFLGSLPHDQVFSWLDSVDIYIQPSKTEGLPRALVEAMSRGISCIGANVGGIPELLDEKFMFSSPKIHIEEICKLILEISPTMMEEQAKRNFIVAQQYDRKLLKDRRSKFFQIFAADVKKRGAK